MAESSEDRALRQRVKDAADEMRQARAGWGTSQETARNYLAARQHQLDVLEQVKAVNPDLSVGGGRIDDAIEAVARNVADIKTEIPKLRPGY
jgi:hypothetical protein